VASSQASRCWFSSPSQPALLPASDVIRKMPSSPAASATRTRVEATSFRFSNVSKLLTGVALAFLAAPPAGAQSFDSSVGSGNTAPSLSWRAEESPAARRGWLFVRAHCAQCHATDRTRASPLASARPLHALNIKYPVADLQRPLAEGVHPMMPAFRLTPSQLADVMAYLKTLDE
jgi:cytochrome c